MDFESFVRDLDAAVEIECDLLAISRLTISNTSVGKRFASITKKQVDYHTDLQYDKDARSCLAAEETKKNKANATLSELKSDLKELDRKLAHLQSKKERLSDDCKELMDRSSMAPSDANILNTLKKKFVLYKEISGLKWDFTCPEEDILGYVRNKRAGTTKYFDLTAKPRDSVWELLKDASHADWSGIGEYEDKENCANGNSKK